jgi:demethylmenaquinone methyltransferase / 2-methoxy-6-polyprenyl-1,4-benzoquinol methylase
MTSGNCSTKKLRRCQSEPANAYSPLHCSRGGIGRRVRLRSAWGNSWRFKSSREHHYPFWILDFGFFGFPLSATDAPHRQQDPQFIQRTFATIARRYDLANHALSLGIDFFWRARAAKIVKGWAPGRVLDLATGSGDLAIALRAVCPAAEITGADFCQPMMLEAQKKGFQRLVNADGTRLPFRDGVFDALTVAFGLRNMASWPHAVREMARVLRPGGHVLILDFSLPSLAPLRAGYRFYLHHILPSVAACVTGDRGSYEYLGESIERFPSGSAMTQLLEEHGFDLAKAEPLTTGIVSIYTATRR